MFFHEEEYETVGVLLTYEDEHPSEHLVLAFADGSQFVCAFSTAFENENGEDDSLSAYDEFHTVVYKIVKVLQSGSSSAKACGAHISVDYKNFPLSVTTEAGEVIYKP